MKFHWITRGSNAYPSRKTARPELVDGLKQKLGDIQSTRLSMYQDNCQFIRLIYLKYVLSNMYYQIIYMYIWESYSFDWLSIIDILKGQCIGIYSADCRDILMGDNEWRQPGQWRQWRQCHGGSQDAYTMWYIRWSKYTYIHYIYIIIHYIYIYIYIYIYKQSMNIQWRYFMILWYDMSNVYIYMCVQSP